MSSSDPQIDIRRATDADVPEDVPDRRSGQDRHHRLAAGEHPATGPAEPTEGDQAELRAAPEDAVRDREVDDEEADRGQRQERHRTELARELATVGDALRQVWSRAVRRLQLARQLLERGDVTERGGNAQPFTQPCGVFAVAAGPSSIG